MTERAANVWYTRGQLTVALHVPDPWRACEAWERIYPPQPDADMTRRHAEIIAARRRKK